MKKFFIASCVTCLCHIVLTQRDVRLPPTLTRWPQGNTLLYNNGSQFTLECGAKGTPSVRYGWKKNGFQLNTSLSNIRKESDGKITVNGPTERDEGYYQCFAKNQYGTTLSNTIHVQMIFIEPASGTPPVLEITVVKGMPFYIQSHQHRSFPKPLYDWYTAVDIDAQYPAKLRPSERIQFADDGDLHFAYALPDDARIYRCTTFYPDSPWESRRSHTRLTVTRNTTEGMRYFAPTLAFSSIVPPVALAGESMKLRCFFYGYPVPTISWIGPENALSTGRYYSLEGFNTTLVLKEIKEYDEGDYSCTASNTQGDNTHTFQIRVAAAPKFQSTKDGLQNVNVTEGDSVMFSCNAFAKPEATVVWFQNGQPIDTDNAPERFVFSNDLKSLTIRDVCRDCVDRESKTDLMVIQCNASNVHGYDFASGYLNVLTKTAVMIKGSRNVPVDFLEERQFVFLCDVISDPSRPAFVRWYKTEPFGDLVRDEPPYVFVTKNILVIMIDPKCSVDCTKYLGEYKCVGDDGYRQEHSTITLSYQYRSSTELTKREDTWAEWKIILVAGAFGAALLIIGIFLGFRLNRRFGALNRRSRGRKLPNPPSLYDRIDYESIDQVLEDMTRRESAMPGSHHLFESAIVAKAE